MSGLYDEAALYDLVSPHDPDIARFYVETVGGKGQSVLELACGSGRFTFPVAESGSNITGGDLSEVMLGSARDKARQCGVSADFQCLDMRDFNLGRTFDSIFIAANSLLHLLTEDDFRRAFAAIRRQMRPTSQLVFDIFVPSAKLLSEGPTKRQPVGSFDHPTLGAVIIEEAVDYDPIRQIARSHWFWSTTDEPNFRETTVQLRQIYPQELPLLLQQNGLVLAERFGNFRRDPLTRESWRQVCIAKLA